MLSCKYGICNLAQKFSSLNLVSLKKMIQMKQFYTLIFLMVLFSIGALAQETINATLMHDDLEREYILYVPEMYDSEKATPLVLCYHGYTSNAEANFNYTNFREIADTAGFILIHPQGTLLAGATHWNVGGWTLASTTDDVGFTDALLDNISAEYNIDQERIYSTGMSNGGFMSFLLACQLSDRIAAVASVTGSMTIQTFAACDPQHPTPILQIHGTMDGTVPYNGDPLWTESIEDVLGYWQEYNNCDEQDSTLEIPDTNSNDGSTVEHSVYDNGDNGVRTEHFKVIGGDHDWPGAWGNQDIHASSEIWQFFAKYDINGLITSPSVGLEDDFSKKTTQIFLSILNDQIALSNLPHQKMKYCIYSTDGRIVQKGDLDSSESNNQALIDIKNLNNNIYFLKIGDENFKVITAN